MAVNGADPSLPVPRDPRDPDPPRDQPRPRAQISGARVAARGVSGREGRASGWRRARGLNR